MDNFQSKFDNTCRNRNEQISVSSHSTDPSSTNPKSWLLARGIKKRVKQKNVRAGGPFLAIFLKFVITHTINSLANVLNFTTGAHEKFPDVSLHSGRCSPVGFTRKVIVSLCQLRCFLLMEIFTNSQFVQSDHT